jgi:hypothetical protein
VKSAWPSTTQTARCLQALRAAAVAAITALAHANTQCASFRRAQAAERLSRRCICNCVRNLGQQAQRQGKARSVSAEAAPRHAKRALRPDMAEVLWVPETGGASLSIATAALTTFPLGTTLKLDWTVEGTAGCTSFPHRVRASSTVFATFFQPSIPQNGIAYLHCDIPSHRRQRRGVQKPWRCVWRAETVWSLR